MATKGKPEAKVTQKNKREPFYEETTFEIEERLTNKKKEYLQEAIADKNGVFNYVEDPIEYKRARK